MTEQPVEVEKGLLSCIAQDCSRVLPLCIGAGLRPRDFILPDHAELYDCFLGIYAKYMTQGATFKTGMRRDLYDYLTELETFCPAIENAPYYLEEMLSLKSE